METNEFFEAGKRLFVEGRMEECIDSFTKALESGYDPKMSHLSRGAAYIKLKESDKALEDFDKVIGLDKNNARAYYYRGMANTQKKDFKKAVADFSKAIELRPDDGASFFARAASLIELGDNEKAVADIKNAANYLAAAVQGYASTIGDKPLICGARFSSVLEGEKGKDLEINEVEQETIKNGLPEG
jgi:tetratricopeptide (TPR) repeat protein